MQPENHNPQFPLVRYGYELEAFLHFDTKFLYSFKILLFRPGQISLDYINNIRGRYTAFQAVYLHIHFALLIIGVFEKQIAKSGYFGTNLEDTMSKDMTINPDF